MKRIFALLLVVATLLTLSAQAMATGAEQNNTQSASYYSSWAEDEQMERVSYYTMATYYDTDFFYTSSTKRVSFEKYCIQITYRCNMANASYNELMLIIDDLNGGGYSKNLTVIADGNSHTMDLYLPAGNYNVHVTGTAGVLYTAFAVNFKAYA